MRQRRWKDVLAVVIIVFLLPYVVTVLVSGFQEKKQDTFPVAGKTVKIEEDGNVEEIDRERYLVGVLAAQIPINYEMETIKAQAVIARTFFIKHEMAGTTIQKHDAEQEYMTTAEMKELWGISQFQRNYQKLSRAVEETAGEMITYQGSPIEPSFHAVSAGATRNGAEVFGSDTYPYLISKTNEKDMQAPNYVTIRTFERAQVEDIIRQNYGDAAAASIGDSLLASFEILEQDSAGYITKIKAVGQTVGGEQFRKQFSLPSAFFEMEELDGNLRIVCKGLGHGFGMSLYGANELAKEGKSYQDILHYYFENIDVSNE